MHDAFVEFHVRNAVHEQATDTIGSFIDRYAVPSLIQLVSGRESCRSTTDDGDVLAGAYCRRLSLHPAFLKPSVDDGAFDVLDGYRWIGDSQNASSFAGGGANTSGELGEVVGFMQPIESFAPASGVDQVVPLRDEVLNWATGS